MHYKRLTEDEIEAKKPEVFIDKKVTQILKSLRDDNFTNELARKKFIDYLSSLHNSSDKRARLTFKKIGQFFTDVGDDLIKHGQE